ncbi:hypothetical protein ABTP70_19610, partial [Acinetobacter baumannii]
VAPIFSSSEVKPNIARLRAESLKLSGRYPIPRTPILRLPGLWRSVRCRRFSLVGEASARRTSGDWYEQNPTRNRHANIGK